MHALPLLRGIETVADRALPAFQHPFCRAHCTLDCFPCSIETVADREGPEAAGGERNVADLLLDQVTTSWAE